MDNNFDLMKNKIWFFSSKSFRLWHKFVMAAIKELSLTSRSFLDLRILVWHFNFSSISSFLACLNPAERSSILMFEGRSPCDWWSISFKKVQGFKHILLMVNQVLLPMINFWKDSFSFLKFLMTFRFYLTYYTHAINYNEHHLSLLWAKWAKLSKIEQNKFCSFLA